MAALMRYCVLGNLNLRQSMIRLFSVHNNYAYGAQALHRSAASVAKDKDTLVSQINNKIDLNIGVSHELFQLLYSSCEKNADSTTELDAALLLYICSIGPFDAPVQKRAEIADEIWNKFEQLGITPSTKLYNIKLKVYTANQLPFNPLDELQKMKSLGLNPDRITYGLLLEGFCQQGNIAGANNVLEAIQKAGYLIGIGIFNSFITGHLKAGSPEEATNVLEVLRSRGLAPDADTYSRFALHYAEEGHIESVLQYVSQADTDGAPVSHITLLDLYRTMVRSGHSSKVEPLLNLISEKGVYRSSAMQKSCQLVSEGFTEAALKLYTVMPKLDKEKFQHNSGSFLLKAMIINGHSAEEVIALSDRIVESNVKSQPHRNALLYAYKADKTDLAVDLLKLMKARNMEIKVPYIIPAICNYRQTGNKEGLHNVIRMLLELDSDVCLEDKVDQLLKFAYPALTALKASRQDIIHSFQDYEKSWNFIFFVADLAQGYSTALKNASGKQLDTSFFQWQDFRQYLFSREQQDWDLCAEVLTYLSQQGMTPGVLTYLAGDALIQSAQNRNWDNVDKVVTALQKKNIKLKKGIQQFQFYSEAPEQLRTKIDQLCESFGSRERNFGRQYVTYAQLESMTIDELETYHKKNPGLKIVLAVLLNKVVETGDLDTIQHKLREYQAAGGTLSVINLLKIVARLTTLGDTESALHYFEEVKHLSGNKIRKMIPLNLASELAKAGNISEALTMIRTANESSFLENDYSENGKLRALQSILKNAPTVDDAYTLHSQIFQTSTILQSNETMRVHAAYITTVLRMSDDAELLARLVKLHEEYHVFPCMEQVLVRFIEKQDVPLLKKVMDLGISVFGSNNFHFKLALCFIESGLPLKAATVLRTPGLMVNEKFFDYGCRHFLKMKKIECLESFANITKDMSVSRGLMLNYLLQGYIAVNNLTKATQVLDQYADGFISPPKEAVALLVKAYISQRLPVPESLRAYTSAAAGTTEAPDTSSSSSSDSESSSSSDEDDNSPDKKTHTDSQEQKTGTKHSPPSKTPK